MTTGQEARKTQTSRIESLRSHIAGGRSTFHAYRYRDTRILYDINTGTLLEPSEAAFALLEGLENGLSAEEIVAAVGKADRAANIETVVCEIESLKSAGLFYLEPLDTPEQREQAIQGHLSHQPRTHQILVQTSCNLKCTYCYEVQAGFHKTGKKMDFETGKRSVDFFLKRAGTRKDLDITFFGGEPLLNFVLIKQLVEYAESRAEELGKTIEFKITTNATLLTDESIKFLVDKRFAVMISMDGPPELADKYRMDLSGRGTTAKALRNAKRLVRAQRANGIREACIRATLARENHSRSTVAQFFEDEGFRRVMIGGSAGRAHEKKEHDIGDDLIPALAAESERNADLFVESLSGGPELPKGAGMWRMLNELKKSLGQAPGVRSTMCGVARNMTAITEKGDLYPCHRYVGEEKYKIGTLQDGIDESRVRRYYGEILEGYDNHCAGCWARGVCGGQCPWYLSRPDGKVGLPDKASCDSIRTGMERALWMYTKAIQAAPGENVLTTEGVKDGTV